MLHGSGSEHERAWNKGIELEKRDLYQGMALAVPINQPKRLAFRRWENNQRLKPEVVGPEYGMTKVMP